MVKPRVIMFGSIGLARKCLEEIILKRDIQLLGVCCVPIVNSWRKDEKSVYDYCIENNIPILKMNEIKDLRSDVGFSIRFNQLIPKDVIDSFSKGIFNTHGGILPSYRGVYSNINALINGEQEYGVTLHYVNEGIDDGDIVDIKKILIKDEDTGFTLYQKGEKLCYKVLEDNIDSILEGSNTRIKQDELIKQGLKSVTYSTKGTLKSKEIQLDNLNKDMTLRVIKAFDSPYHEPAYMILNGKKIYLRTTWK